MYIFLHASPECKGMRVNRANKFRPAGRTLVNPACGIVARMKLRVPGFPPYLNVDPLLDKTGVTCYG
jgi:hypothetical protein